MSNDKTPKKEKDAPKRTIKLYGRSYITKSEKTNVCNAEKGSCVDKTNFRPDIASVRDKAIALAQNGSGRVGVYDINNDKENENTPVNLLQQIAYARRKCTDITEIERARDYLSTEIEKAKLEDKKNLANKIAEEKTTKLFENIEKNTRQTETES